MSLLQAPTKVKEKLEGHQRNFLWDTRGSTRKIHLVNWEAIKTPKKSEGFLGVKDLKVFNKELIGK